MLSAAALQAGPALCQGLLARLAAGQAASTAAAATACAARGAPAWRTYAAAAAGESRVHEVDNDAEFEREIKQLAASGAVGVVDFTAKWCGPCKAVAPVYEQLSRQYPTARFLKVDIDNEQLQRTVMDHGITGVPTFAFYKGSQRVEAFTGARVDLLKSTLGRLGGGGGGASGGS
ncbi:hypothetical protein Rsub_09192 [Raphidocelis subcapitata]|uniref:Thioredoxin domain-containing protein n=1 Tax=Raphidocelis subcapitata TaxID=307507 RepID=A0A2V0PER9_9CHLO|nr:hypothetical protein Rsub_09192 [Raphidocelis subcapitata]|eukprot:GBF96393.1 hypothetical protein Rsub_09192 [Raphidocelis subcapitata]